MRGGQVTVFVMLGLLLLLLAGILSAVLYSPVQERRPANGQIVSTLIGSCIDSTVTAELTLLGQHGGVVSFTDESPSDTVRLPTGRRKILYGITPNAGGDILPETFPPPRYPDYGVSIENTERNPATGESWPEWMDGYFGDVHFPGLCDPTGTNGLKSPLPCETYPGIPPGTPGGRSVQELLEDRIARRVQSCASPRQLSEILGEQIEMIQRPQANVTFTLTNTIVTVTFPAKLVGKPTLRFHTITRDYPLRYLPLMRFVRALAKKDTRDVQFNMAADYSLLPEYEPGFTVMRQDDVQVASGKHADLFTVVDSKSTLDGRSFTFSFLVEHRTPMLDPLSQEEFTKVLAGDTSFARGADPDDRQLVFSTSTDPPRVFVRRKGYPGWPADYQEG